jgi:hypothetical protein
MPDILTISPSRQPPALNTTSDMPVIDAKPAAPAPAPAPAPAAATDAPAPAPAPAAADATDGKKPDATATPDPDQAEEAAVTRKPWFQKRIDELTRKHHEADRRAQAEAEARARLEAELAARTQAPEVVKPEDDPEPAKADFTDPDAYTDARARWAARDESRKERKAAHDEAEKRRATENEARARTTIEAMHSAHNERIAKAKVDLPDFDKVALRDDVRIPIQAFAEIERSEMGPQVMYAIGKDPSLATALTEAYGAPQSLYEHQLGLTRVVRKLVDIEAGIKAERSRTVTKAAEPIEPLAKGGGGSTPKAPEDMSMEEYDAWLTPQLNAGRRPFAPAPRRKT